MLTDQQKSKLARLEMGYSIKSSNSEDTIGRIIDVVWAVVGEALPALPDNQTGE